MSHNISTDLANLENQKADLLKTVAVNLKKFRNNADLTQEQLAEKTDLSPETIGNLENAKSWFSLDSLIKISSALKIRPFELLLNSSTDEVVPIDLVSTYMGGFTDFVKTGGTSYNIKNSKRKDND